VTGKAHTGETRAVKAVKAVKAVSRLEFSIVHVGVEGRGTGGGRCPYVEQNNVATVKNNLCHP
jgi:hypothetical protein